MAADHSNTISVTIVLAPSPPSRAGFGTVLLIVDEAEGTGNDLNGERVVSYANITEAQAAATAGYISAATLARLTVAFSQRPVPSAVKVGRIDTGGGETYSTGFTAIKAADPDFYGIVLDSRTDANILLVSADVETDDNRILVAQSDDADWLTSGLPAGLSALDARERTAVVFHDEDTEYADIAWAVSRLVWDPDVQSAQWEGQIRGVAALTSGLTAAQRDFVVANNANVGLPFSSAAVYVSPGNNCNGRGLYEIVTSDWFRARVSEDTADLKLGYTARGEKLTVNALGQTAILGILNGRLQQGIDAQHFNPGQVRATALDISAADIAARRLRFTVEAQIAQDARLFDFTVYMQQDPVIEE